MAPKTKAPLMSFQWVPGQGYSQIALERMRLHFKQPKKPMGEAWFMGGTRFMYTSLCEDLRGISAFDLQKPLTEIISGSNSFGPIPEWIEWYHYLMPQLLPRSHENFVESLLEYLIGGFFVNYPDGILESPYPEFREDVFATLGQCMMNDECWEAGQIRIGEILCRSNHCPAKIWGWDSASGDFSASVFFCMKYLQPEEMESWLRSVLAIKDPHWIAQIMVWLVGAYDMLVGKMKLASELEFSARPNVTWASSHSLSLFYRDHPESEEPMQDFLPEWNRREVLRVLDVVITEALVFEWFDAIKTFDYLESELMELPSRFADLYLLSKPQHIVN